MRLRLTPANSVLVAVPMFHANGWGFPFAAPAVGAKLVLPGRQTDGARLAKLIRDEGVTVAAGVQTVWLGCWIISTRPAARCLRSSAW